MLIDLDQERAQAAANSVGRRVLELTQLFDGSHSGQRLTPIALRPESASHCDRHLAAERMLETTLQYGINTRHVYVATHCPRDHTHGDSLYKCARTCQIMYNITSRRLPAREAHKHSAQVFLAETGGISMLRCRDVYAGYAPRQTIQAPTHVPSWMRIHVSSKNRQRKYAKPYAFLDTPYGCF